MDRDRCYCGREATKWAAKTWRENFEVIVSTRTGESLSGCVTVVRPKLISVCDECAASGRYAKVLSDGEMP